MAISYVKNVTNNIIQVAFGHLNFVKVALLHYGDLEQGAAKGQQQQTRVKHLAQGPSRCSLAVLQSSVHPSQQEITLLEDSGKVIICYILAKIIP